MNGEQNSTVTLGQNAKAVFHLLLAVLTLARPPCVRHFHQHYRWTLGKVAFDVFFLQLRKWSREAK